MRNTLERLIVMKTTKLIAIVERPSGDTYEQTISTKYGDEKFTKVEKRNAIDEYIRQLGKDYIICDVYEE